MAIPRRNPIDLNGLVQLKFDGDDVRYVGVIDYCPNASRCSNSKGTGIKLGSWVNSETKLCSAVRRRHYSHKNDHDSTHPDDLSALYSLLSIIIILKFVFLSVHSLQLIQISVLFGNSRTLQNFLKHVMVL